MLRARLALAGLCLVAGGGCLGIEHHVRGVVLHTQTERCGDVPARTAVSGATVRVECPAEGSTEVVIEAVTEMGGRFRLEPSRFDADCAIVVTKEGYRKRRYPVTELCVDAMAPGSSCDAASITAHLVPSRTPASSPSNVDEVAP